MNREQGFRETVLKRYHGGRQDRTRKLSESTVKRGRSNRDDHRQPLDRLTERLSVNQITECSAAPTPPTTHTGLQYNNDGLELKELWNVYYRKTQ